MVAVISDRNEKTFLSFFKFEVYTAFVIAATEIVSKNTISLNWKLVGVAVAVGCVKAALTWFTSK